MTIQSRNTFIRLFSTVNSIFFVGALIVVSWILTTGQAFMSITYSQEELLVTPSAFLPIFFLLLYSCLGSVVSYYYFKRTASAEYFFFAVFILAQGLEIFRLIAFFFLYTQTPFYFVLLASRIIYFGRILSIASLFCSGLFSVGLSMQKLENVFFMCFFFAFFIAVLVPLDMNAGYASFIYETGIQHEFRLFSFAALFLAVFNFVLASLKNSHKDYFFMAAGFLLCIAGWMTLHFQQEALVSSLAFFSLAAGSFIFGKWTYKVYLWV